MSYKRKPENIAFSVAVTPDKKKKFENEDTRSVAVLAPFNPFPKVSFENIKLHSTAVREVYLVNPTENALQVELTKLPDEARGYHWSATDFELPKESQAKLIIAWTPSEYGSWHDSIKIVNKKTKKPLSELKLSSTTEEPPKVSKRSLKSRGFLTKRLNNPSKKSSLVKVKSENKENELTYISNSKKQTHSRVCIENENVIIYESNKSFQNKTFTQIKQDDLDDQHCSKTSETCIQSVATIALSQNSNQLQLGASTLRRGAYDVTEPVISSRRSTYSLRNRHITNIIDVEEEKKEFELLASPGIHNKSLEIAASNLVSQNVSIELSTVDEAEQSEAACSATFTVQPSVTYSLVKDPSPHSSVTFNVLEVPFSPLAKISSHQSSTVNQLQNNEQSERLSLESVLSSEKFYDSLEEKQTLESFKRKLGVEGDKSQDLFVDWDEVYDIDKFSSRTPEKLHKIKCSFSKLSQKEDESLNSLEPSQRNSELCHCRGTLSEEVQASSSNLLFEFPYRNITHRRKPDNIPSMSPLNRKKVSDSLENLTSPKNLNHTKDTLLQLDEDFGKFSFSIVSSSPVNLQNVLSNNLNRTFTPAGSNSGKTDCQEKNIEENALSIVHEKTLLQNFNEEDISFSNYSKYSKINNSGLVGAEARQEEKHVVRAELKYLSEEENVSSNGTQNDLTQQRTAHEAEQMKHSLSRANKQPDKQVSSDSKHHILKWNISPPQNSKEEEEGTRQKSKGHNLPKIKTPALQTPVRLTRAKSSLSYLASNTNISQLKDEHCLQVHTNCKKSSEPSNSDKENKTDNKNPNRHGIYSEEVFLVPPMKIKRGSLQKTMNGSPPKIRKLSQEPKIKRLSTPSMCRKLPLTEEKQQNKADFTRSLPRSAMLMKKRKSLKVADWVPVVRKLKLTSAGSQSEEDISSSPVDLATPDPFLAATTLNPFAKGGLYLNNKWLKEQEVELIQWTDRMLRPPNELELDRDQSERSTLHRLNALRTTAFSILTSTDVATVLSRVKRAVEKNIISIRSDRQLHADLGLQDKIISLLMSYNPLWLRLCLEAVYQCNIQLKCHSDETGLRDFIRTYVLNDEYLRKAYSHPTVPHLMLPQFEDEMKKFTVYKFLVIVYLLDLVKSKKVILHDPCLFKKNSKLKSSKEILIDFNKEFVAGAGDITRILRLRGYEVSHCQTYIDEFDFSLTSPKELRDGVRLTRLAENLVGDNLLCSKLRVPAVSNLQKKFNAEVAFSALKKAGYDLPLDVSPKDISDGHNEKTLSFLWHLRGIFQKRAVLLIITKWRETKQLRADRKNFLKLKSSALKIQRWYRKIKQARVLSDEELRKGCEARENFLKLKAVVVQLQRRFRKRKEQRDFKKKCLAAAMIQSWYRNQKGVFKDRNNFKALRQAAITIQRAFRNYKSKKNGSALVERKYFMKIRAITIMVQRRFRFIQLAKHQRQDFLAIKTAAIKIQRRFRANKQVKNHRHTFLAIKSATVTIQRRFKAFLTAKQQRHSFIKKKTAATIIQRRFRAYKHCKSQRKEFLNIKTATVKIQRKYRAFLFAKRQRQDFLEIKATAIMIQRWYRTKREVKRCREEYIAIKIASVVLQRRFRAFILTKHERKHFIEKKRATIILQRRFRANKLVKNQRNQFLAIKTATVAIQRRFRAIKQGKTQREHFLTIKSAALIIQRRFRGYLIAKHQREEFLAKKTAAVMIQRWFRANKQAQYQRKLFMSIKTAAVTIQRRFRDHKLANQQRQLFLKMRSAAIIIQKIYRGHKLAKQQRSDFITFKTAVVKIQRRFRTFQLAKKQRQNFLLTKTAAITVQRTFRANKEARMQRKQFCNMKNAAIVIQRRFRSFLLAKHERQDFLLFKAAAIMIQKRFKANKQAKCQRKEFISIKTATVTIQRRFRSFLLAKQQRLDFLEMKTAAITIQKIFRAKKKAIFFRKKYLAVKTAAVTIQRRFRALLLAKQQRQNYLELKAAVIKIQRIFRTTKQARMLREEFIAKKTAAVKIQRKFRELQLAKQHRQDFLAMKSAAIVIQKKYRGYKLAKQQREEFSSIKTAVVKIQRRFRSFQLAKKQRQNFLSTKTAAITVQRMFRANKETKIQMKHFLKIKNAAVIIQRRFRASHLTKIQRQDFLALKAAAVTTQRRFRANKLAKSHREHFLVIRTAAVVIQTRFIAFLRAKHQRQEFLTKKTAVLTLQRKFRAYKQAKIQREKFFAMKNATVTIQRRFRALLTAKHHRQEYLSLKSATVTIQRHFRAKKVAKEQRQNYIRLKAAAITVQRKFRKNRTARTILEASVVARKVNAAFKIQAAWRGYLVRKTVTVPQPPKTKPASFEASTDNHQMISTRGQRYFKVLSNHRKYSVAELQNTLFNIDKITLLSADQCEYFVRNGAVKILYEILEHQSNRAFGVHTCVELILSILLNLYRAPITAEIVWKETGEVNGIFFVFDLMMRFKTEKTSTVFCKACTVIWLFAQDPVKAQVIMKTPKIQEIYKYVVKSMKKNEQPSTSGLKQDSKRSEQSRVSTKKPVSGARKKFPALRFNWGNYFDDHRAFDDKSFALNSVIDKLDRFLKT